MSKTSELDAVFTELEKCGRTLAEIAIDLRKMFSTAETDVLNGFEEIYDPATDEAHEETQQTHQKTITLEEIRGLAASKAQSGLRKEVKALVMKYGVASLSVLPEDKFPEFMAELEAM